MNMTEAGMDGGALNLQKRRGRPRRVPLDSVSVQDLDPNPRARDAFFDFADRLLLLEKRGHAQEDLGRALGLSQPSVSRYIKAAAWPAGIRARILLADPMKFPVETLVRLARTTWKDQGRVSSDGRRRVLKSRMTLRAAVDLIIEGKSPFAAAIEPARARARRMEEIANEERSARQAQKAELERLEAENRQLRADLSMDKYSDALRKCAQLEAEVVRLRAVPDAGEPVRKPRDEDLKRADAGLAESLGLGPADVETLDSARGLVLVRARNAEVLDGLREKISLLRVVRFKHGRAMCSSCRGMIA
jgi:hypothetical protein